jgi:hypothetical protein
VRLPTVALATSSPLSASRRSVVITVLEASSGMWACTSRTTNGWGTCLIHTGPHDADLRSAQLGRGQHRGISCVSCLTGRLTARG